MATRKKRTTKGTVGGKQLAKTKRVHKKATKASAFVTSKEYVPITKRTYELETKRKKSTAGYKKKNGKYFKAQTVVK